jgi:hypothetical protein
MDGVSLSKESFGSEPLLENDNCFFLLRGRCTKPNRPPPDLLPVASQVGPLRLGGIAPQFLPNEWNKRNECNSNDALLSFHYVSSFK